MTPQSIQEVIDRAEGDLLQLSDTIADLKRELNRLIEENNQLRLTNQELKDLLVQRSYEQASGDPSEEPNEAEVFTGGDRLRSFYDDGIHICHVLFGTRLLEGEECIFCQNMLDKLDEGEGE